MDDAILNTCDHLEGAEIALFAHLKEVLSENRYAEARETSGLMKELMIV